MTPHANAQNIISGKSVNFMQSDVYSEKLKTASNALLDDEYQFEKKIKNF